MELNQEWSEYSTLTVYEAAFMLVVRADPKLHELRCESDAKYAEYFNGRHDTHELIWDKCKIIESAILANVIEALQKCQLNAGVLDFHRTVISKQSFLEWCGKKDQYSFVVAAFAVADRNSSTVSKSASAQPTDWRDFARDEATQLFEHDTQLRTRDTLAGYSRRVMTKLQETGIHGPRGRIDNPKTIQREALQGPKWWANMRK